MLACSQRTSTDHDILNRSCSGSQSKANEEDNKSLDKENEAEPGEKEIKDFVIIGNGPSGISLSYMLSGNLPYYTGQSQDDMLHSRLTVDPDLSLVEQDLEFLADGLEGRSNNPVSLLLDCLQRPQADLGLDLEPLLSWRSEPAAGSNHVVLGRGKPGGVWQTLDGNLKTVSLGAWMQLPNLSMPEWEEHNTALVNRRTSVSSVAQYYTDYVDIMGISQNFRNHTVVSSVRQVDRCAITENEHCCLLNNQSGKSLKDGYCQTDNDRCKQACIAHSKQSIHSDTTLREPELEDVFTIDADDDFNQSINDLSSECSSFTTRHSASPWRSRSEARPYDPSDDCSVGRSSTDDQDSTSPCCSCFTDHNSDTENRGSPDPFTHNHITMQDYEEICPSWDPIINPYLFSAFLKSSLPRQCQNLRHRSITRGSFKSTSFLERCGEEGGSVFEVTGYEIVDAAEPGTRQTKHFKYLTKNVVLATGLDKPNALGVPGEQQPFVIHSLGDLDKAVENGGLTSNSDPIMIIGAGLSAADAIISAQGYNIPVVHVFRRPVDDPQLIFNKLPVNLYPEYHNVHKMMAEGSIESSRWLHGGQVEHEHPTYRAFSETDVDQISKERRVRLRGPNTHTEIKVSYVLVLIGAAPRLEFLETSAQLGRVPGAPIDKNNPIDIDVYTHQSTNVQGLFAMGPLVGDNFVRFLQGGALAIASFVHKLRTQQSSN